MLFGFLLSSLYPSLEGPMLLRHPTVSKTSVAFSFAGDIWSVSREGGIAARLTTSAGAENNPFYSPDGQWIAFTAEYNGNNDVYIVQAEGGEPKRLTFHPGTDIAIGWTPDGRSVLMLSGQETETDLPALYTISVDGGQPKRLPLPSGSQGSYSADGTRIAYNPGIKWQESWKRYRGGQASKIWIADLADSKVKTVTRTNSNDTHPMWLGDKVYFLSDREGAKTLYAYDTRSEKVTRLVDNQGFDIKSASEGDGVIALEHFGAVELYDIATGKVSKLDVKIAGEFPEARPQFKDFSKTIGSVGLSPNGLRAIFAARGDIWTVPASKGDARNLSQTETSCERDPAWAPDGQSIAYFSDASGEYKLVVQSAVGKTDKKSYKLEGDCYYYQPTWSPDCKKIAYTDNKHNLWSLDLASGKSTLIDTNPYENPLYVLNATWSPDSKWLAYHRDLDSHIAAVFLYSFESGKSTQVTDGLSDARYPAFDNGGKYLYFAASTNSGPSAAWLDLSSFRNINSQSSIYCAVLRNDLPSPLAPESDDEATKGEKPAEKPVDFRIDLDGLDQRIIALPLPAKAYVGISAGPANSFLVSDIAPLATITSQPLATLTKFSLDSKTPTPIMAGFQAASFTPNGEKMLYLRGGAWGIASTAAPVGPGAGAIDLSGMRSIVDPQKEWKQMFHEALRIQRDFFYDPNHHGIDLNELEKRYEPFLANLRSRDDLNYLFEDMLGEICVGHMYIGGGDTPTIEGEPGGLLGADYEIEGGKYRFARIFNGENWNPGLRAPLTQPGVNVKVGEFLLEIDGKAVNTKQSIHEALQGKAGKQVTLKVASSASGTGSREVIVVPTESEAALRHLAWREDNRRKVEKLSGGHLGYVHIPDTNIGGWTNFNRYFYAQVGKEGIIVDERFNHGGQVDDFMVENLNRPLASMWTSRYGKDFSSPLSAIYGPKVMIVNEYAGSGGDYFPWHFKKAKVGPVVGHRTWGGLVGILNFPSLIDGGGVTSPNIAFYNPDGKWDVENYGVDPDIAVEMDPALWRQGRDPQLERAVEEGMKLLAKQPKSTVKKPAYPDKSSVDKIKR